MRTSKTEMLRPPTIGRGDAQHMSANEMVPEMRSFEKHVESLAKRETSGPHIHGARHDQVEVVLRGFVSDADNVTAHVIGKRWRHAQLPPNSRQQRMDTNATQPDLRNGIGSEATVKAVRKCKVGDASDAHPQLINRLTERGRI